MLDLLKPLKGLKKEMLIHGPKKDENILINLRKAPNIDCKAFCHMLNILYSKKKNYKLNPREEIQLFKDLKDAGINKKKISFNELTDYRVYIFNNRHKLQTA
ncbi:MAG: hypothetical protein ABIH00_07290 [Armatimonadota bacterium]